jgi:hypothetical protein
VASARIDRRAVHEGWFSTILLYIRPEDHYGFLAISIFCPGSMVSRENCLKIRTHILLWRPPPHPAPGQPTHNKPGPAPHARGPTRKAGDHDPVSGFQKKIRSNLSSDRATKKFPGPYSITPEFFGQTEILSKYF